MLNIFVPQSTGLVRIEAGLPPGVPDDAVWIDLLEPTQEEEKLVEATLGIDVPTREEMKEIETSNRLYEDNGALYMTTTVAAQLDTDRPVSMAVTFILVGQRLVTNRYIDTKPFQQFVAYAQKHPAACQNPLSILAGLMEAFTERIADILERVGGGSRQHLRQHFCAPWRGHAQQPRPAFPDRAHRLQRRTGFQSAREPGQPRASPDVRATVGQRGNERRAA